MLKPFKRRSGLRDDVADYLEQLDQIPLLNGKLVDFDFGSGATAIVVKHGLGRTFRGAFVVSQSIATLSLVIASAAVVERSGLADPKLALIVACVGSSTTMTGQLWVF